MESATVACPKPHSTLTPSDDGVSAFIRLQSRLFGIAYRLLGNAAEAEDIVQDVWMRWQMTDRHMIRDAAAFLATATSRMAINRVRSARLRLETSLGNKQPDPIDTRADPSASAERGEALEVAMLILLGSLTPRERAAYVLREAFNYEYAQIAAVVRSNEANCRQLLVRARKHIAGGRLATCVPPEKRRLFDAFLGAAQLGDLVELERLFASSRWPVSRASLTV